MNGTAERCQLLPTATVRILSQFGLKSTLQSMCYAMFDSHAFHR